MAFKLLFEISADGWSIFVAQPANEWDEQPGNAMALKIDGERNL